MTRWMKEIKICSLKRCGFKCSNKNVKILWINFINTHGPCGEINCGHWHRDIWWLYLLWLITQLADPILSIWKKKKWKRKRIVNCSELAMMWLSFWGNAISSIRFLFIRTIFTVHFDAIKLKNVVHLFELYCDYATKTRKKNSSWVYLPFLFEKKINNFNWICERKQYNPILLLTRWIICNGHYKIYKWFWVFIFNAIFSKNIRISFFLYCVYQ